MSEWGWGDVVDCAVEIFTLYRCEVHEALCLDRAVIGAWEFTAVVADSLVELFVRLCLKFLVELFVCSLPARSFVIFVKSTFFLVPGDSF